MAKVRKHGGNFNPNLNARLLASVEEAARNWDSPYEFQLTSGYRPGDPRQHGEKNALDFALYDPETGAQLDNYKQGAQFEPYQQFANHWYQSLTPEEQAQARWGGYFGNPDDPNYKTKYGNQDPMHLDFGRTASLGMLSGDWKTGFNEKAMKALGIKDAGGLENVVAQVAQQTGKSPEEVKRAFLGAISSTESPGYDVLYGGEKFADMSRHPHREMPIMKDGQVVGHSSAAGKYQFIQDTWDEQAKKYGYKDFSPETQDTAAWNYANEIYKAKTGGSLEEALASNDPARINAAAEILNKTWTSLPGGSDQSKGYGGKSFADVYSSYMNNAAGGSGVHPQNPQVGTGGFIKPGAPTTQVANKPEPAQKPDWWKKMLTGLGEGAAGAMGAAATPEYNLPGTPAAAVSRAEPMSYVDVQGAEIKRQKLAEAMARLQNPTSLWG